MRESTVFLIGMICLMVGAVLGVIIHYIVSERHIADLNEELLSKFERIKKQNEIIRRLIDENNRLQVENVKNRINARKLTKIMSPNHLTGFFEEIVDEPLPDHFADDIDFGGKF